MPHPDDGKHVVVQGGQRVSGQLHESLEKAKAEADALRAKRPVVETGKPGASPESPKVVQNLLG